MKEQTKTIEETALYNAVNRMSAGAYGHRCRAEVLYDATTLLFRKGAACTVLDVFMRDEEYAYEGERKDNYGNVHYDKYIMFDDNSEFCNILATKVKDRLPSEDGYDIAVGWRADSSSPWNGDGMHSFMGLYRIFPLKLHVTKLSYKDGFREGAESWGRDRESGRALDLHFPNLTDMEYYKWRVHSDDRKEFLGFVPEYDKGFDAGWRDASIKDELRRNG